jgi:hypothetical protein
MRRQIGRAVASAEVFGQVVLSLSASAETAVLPAARDATLIESSTGALANGAGPAFFVGRTGQRSDSRRRAVLAFDVAGALPGGATVTAVSLELELTPSNAVPILVSLHRVTADWSEGPSAASGGSGAASVTGDVTWLHRRYDTEEWSHPGGDFAVTASAAAEIADAGSYHFESGADLVANVQAWLDEPASNDGWILIGGEDAASTAKRFSSREAGREGEGPRLVIDYVPPCDAADLPARARGICRAYCEALDCDGSEPSDRAQACEQLARRFDAATGGDPLPCERPPAPVSACPCFTSGDVTALVLALQNSSLYSGVDCLDSTPTKPLVAVSAFRVDGADCSANSADCSALAVTFTEDNACQLNPPEPAEPILVDGISDTERDACRDAILAGALAAGVPCE